ncbi:MAG TPA: NAD(P)-binding protein [Solirubrobacteraceae bacterium]|nr:NAD(P)-binding protein [Solirubrobacteraceae bacterium]
MGEPGDLTSVPDLASAQPTAGPARSERPVYIDLLPPCNAACPAGENIQAWLAHVQAGEHEPAWRTIVEDNPLPAVHGRVCYHPCEDSCNRAQLDTAVSIHAVERFLGDLALKRGWALPEPAPSTGRRVLVVGAGPSGLCAAYHLLRRGHEVEIRDLGDEPGGMLRFGIPEYRLPSSVLAAEVRRIEQLGVRIVLGHRVEDVVAEQEEGRFDAVFAAVGAHLPKHVDIPARDASRVIDAISLLRSVASGQRPQLGRRVAVYGGGNSAMDAARVAKRLGADEAMIVYRRTREAMPAHEEEAEQAEREGVQVNWLRTITAFDAPELTVEVMQLDEDGRPLPTGRFETLAADTVVLAVGQDADTGFLRRVPGITVAEDGVVQVSPSFMTGRPGLFAGGDMVPSVRSVTVAAGHGKAAARSIHAYLSGIPDDRPAKHPLASFDKLHPWYFDDAPQREQLEEPPEERIHGFDEVTAGLGAREARFEASRCLSCGNCFECDGCLGACPEHAVIKLGPGRRYRIDLDRCTGCRACFEQCPVHAIDMVPEGAA